MNPIVGQFGVWHRLALLAAAVTFASLAVLGGAVRAQAMEKIYWDNYSDNPATIGSAAVDGSGGALVELGGFTFKSPEGMAYDPVANRLYIAAERPTAPSEGEIVYVNLDGSGGGVFSTPGAPVDIPQGIALDPVTRTLYWANTKSETIAWAKLDGGAGGQLNTTGASLKGVHRLALDPAGGRLFWTAETGSEEVVSYANLDQTGGGVLPVTLGPLASIDGLATNPVDGRLYLLGEDGGEGELASVPMDGGSLAEVPLGSAFNGGYGLAIDPVLQKGYWGNYNAGVDQPEALGFTGLGGSPGTISPFAVHTSGVQDPVILKSPTGAGAPQVSQAGSALACSQGTWSLDYPGANVFTAPSSYGYQWSLNGQAIPGATGSTLTATVAGAYGCTVTGTNAIGSATQSATASAGQSAGGPAGQPGSAVTVTPTSLTITFLSKEVHVKAGKPALVKLRIANGGDITSPPVTVCATLTRKAKRGLIAPKCASVGSLGLGASATATLKVKTKKTARGIYKLTTKVTGASLAPATVSIKVIAAKKHKQKHHKKA